MHFHEQVFLTSNFLVSRKKLIYQLLTKIKQQFWNMKAMQLN